MIIITAIPDSPYETLFDTGVMLTTIVDAFIGPTFITDTGEQLSICMRDSGFELTYITDGIEQTIELKDGTIR